MKHSTLCCVLLTSIACGDDPGVDGGAVLDAATDSFVAADGNPGDGSLDGAVDARVDGAEPVDAGVPPEPAIYIDWTGDVNRMVSAETENWNRLTAYSDWGLSWRSDYSGVQVQLYADTDPGVTGPGGEEWGVETEIGALTVPARSPGTLTLRHYMDCGQTGLSDGNTIDRSEVHIRDTLDGIGAEEDTTLWMGWSERYTHIDRARLTTVLQFRNQPSRQILEDRGFAEGDFNWGEVMSSGPATSIEITRGRYRFGTRQGFAHDWTTTGATADWDIEDDVWYDIIVQMRFSQGDDGRYRAWVYDTRATDAASYAITDEPSFDRIGNTMYEYPVVAENPNYISAPQLRWGIYRFNCKANNINGTTRPAITDADRHMTKHTGPVRFWVGSDETYGFRAVQPRN